MGARSQTGQATIEWVGLVMLVSLLVAALATAGERVAPASLGAALAQRLVCAADADRAQCSAIGDTALVAAYGPELASELRRRAPRIEYEPGMRVLPVDFRSCRRNGCAYGPASGAAVASGHGEPVTLFTRAVDCRGSPPGTAVDRADCSGERAGRLYLQYWAYYPDSRTRPWGARGYHPDDWESFQVRIGPQGAESRASSHHGYNYAAGLGSWPSDAGVVSRSAWHDDLGTYYVSAGSHAGHAYEPSSAIRLAARGVRAAGVPRQRLRYLSRSWRPRRWTPSAAIRLVPLEPLAPRAWRWRFAVTPPWRKAVYSDPEDRGTD